MADRKKVLHVIQSLRSGGCENMLLRTLPHLSDFDHLILTLKEHGELRERFEDQEIPVRSIHQKGWFDFSSYRRLLDEVRTFQPDLIFTYLFHADSIGRLFLQTKVSVPVIPFLRTTYKHRRYFPALLFEYLTHPLTKQYLANSDAVKTFYSQQLHVPYEKITVIENGLDLNRYLEDPQSDLRKELHITPTDTIIICIANLHSNKGYRYLLDAFEEASRTYPDLQLIIVGEGEEKKRLLKKIESFSSQERIHFLGRRSDIPELLAISQIFVLPTLFEGMSNALLEAMASGKAIITTNIPENCALIDDKKNGLLVPPQDSIALTKALLDLLAHPEKGWLFGREAQGSIRTKFSLEIISQKWRSFILTACSKL